MKCKDCFYRKDLAVKDDHAFDTRYAVKFTKDIDYCTHHLKPCEDAYLECEYRDIKVEAQHIQHAINLLEGRESLKELAIIHLKKILKGEIE